MQVHPSQILNFPKDTSPSGLALFGKLGNGKWLEVQISQFRNFPKDLSPSGSALFGKLGSGYRYILPNFPISQKTPAQMGQHDWGNWEIGIWPELQISQFPKRSQPIWLSTIWEIGKSVEVHTSQFPNFPNNPSPDGPALFGKLGNGKWLEVQISQFRNFPKDLSPSGSALFGKLGSGYRYILPNFPISQKTPAQMGQHDWGNWEIGIWPEVQISQFPKRSQPIWLSTIWEIGKSVEVHTSQFPK